jgi:hypothetical protein
MRKASLILVSIAWSALPAAAQTSTVGTQPVQSQTVTLNGCVSSVNNSPSAFTLLNPVVVPTSPQPGTPTNVPAPTPIGTTAAQPQPTPAQPPATPPVSRPATPPVNVPAAIPATPPATVATPPPNPATTGVTSASPATTGINAASPTTGINAASPTTANSGGFFLSGANVSPFSGRRVQVVGVIVPPANARTAGAVATTGVVGAPVQEFRVQSVQPIDGDCPQQ